MPVSSGLLDRFRGRISPVFTWRTEMPIPIEGDLRAWDVALTAGRLSIGVDAETRLRDVQAVDRRIMLKLRDSGFDAGSAPRRGDPGKSTDLACRRCEPDGQLSGPVRGGAPVAREGPTIPAATASSCSRRFRHRFCASRTLPPAPGQAHARDAPDRSELAPIRSLACVRRTLSTGTGPPRVRHVCDAQARRRHRP